MHEVVCDMNLKRIIILTGLTEVDAEQRKKNSNYVKRVFSFCIFQGVIKRDPKLDWYFIQEVCFPSFRSSGGRIPWGSAHLLCRDTGHRCHHRLCRCSCHWVHLWVPFFSQVPGGRVSPHILGNSLFGFKTQQVSLPNSSECLPLPDHLKSFVLVIALGSTYWWS